MKSKAMPARCLTLRTPTPVATGDAQLRVVVEGVEELLVRNRDVFDPLPEVPGDGAGDDVADEVTVDGDVQGPLDHSQIVGHRHVGQPSPCPLSETCG